MNVVCGALVDPCPSRALHLKYNVESEVLVSGNLCSIKVRETIKTSVLFQFPNFRNLFIVYSLTQHLKVLKLSLNF
jgi:hypothetical protein